MADQKKEVTNADGGGKAQGPKKFEFFVDGSKLESTEEFLTGAQIKAMAGIDPSVGLFEEAGSGPDNQISNSATVDLKTHRHFFTMPPAKMG
jgi:hypothetical protein